MKNSQARVSRALKRGVLAIPLLTLLGNWRPAFCADEIHWTITGQTSVAFDWRGSNNTIRFGTTTAYNRMVFANPPDPYPFSSPGPFWEAHLTGLAENTLYHYSVGFGPDHTFRTPPARGSSNFTVHAMGDIGSTLENPAVAGVQSLIAAGNPHFVLALGDLTYGNRHGQIVVDQHFNDVMVWSQDIPYMPVWGNHEWDYPEGDDLRNYKGRFHLPNAVASAGAPSPGCCGEDWYWFDYGDVRFVAIPDRYPGAYADWYTQVGPIMAAAQSDSLIRFIVTFGHRPAYTSGNYAPGELELRAKIDSLGVRYDKFRLNLAAHDHNYQRSHPQRGVVHVTAGTGGSGVYPFGSNQSWSAARLLRHGALRLKFTPAGIEGTLLCGPASSGDNVTCTVGSVIDSFFIAPPTLDLAPQVTAPATVPAAIGTEVAVQVVASDPDSDPIASLAVDLSSLPFPHGATFTVGPGNASGTLKWTPPPVASGSSYRVSFIGSNALSDTVATDIQVAQYSAPQPTVILERRIAAGPDDAEERASGAIDMVSSDLELMIDGSTQRAVGLRFTPLAIPRGVNVTRAYLVLKAAGLQSEPTTLTILGQAIDDAPAFTSTAGSLSARMTAQAATTARVTWADIPPWTTLGALHETPDLAGVVQEIVNRPGWQSGNALVILINGSGHRTAETYDHTPAGAALLHVEYTQGSGTVGVGPGSSPILPPGVALTAWVVPNPLRNQGTLHYVTRDAGPARAELFDLRGRRVRLLFDSPNVAPGRHAFDIEDRDENGKRLTAGVYFYRVTVGTVTVSGRLSIVD